MFSVENYLNRTENIELEKKKKNSYEHNRRRQGMQRANNRTPERTQGMQAQTEVHKQLSKMKTRDLKAEFGENIKTLKKTKAEMKK